MHKLKQLICSPFRLLVKVCTILGALTLLTMLSLGLMVFAFFQSLPDVETRSFTSLKKEAQLLVQKKLKGTDNAKKQSWTPIKNINRELLFAVVMAEDSEYFKHNGVNFNALIDSLATNIRKREYEMGASTITQQVVKNLFLTHEKSLVRKFKEILIARDLESRFSKNEILEVYFNIAEFGPDLYGIDMASRHYFNLRPSDISAVQGAYLSLMLTSPRRNYFSIHKNKFLSKTNHKKLQRILRDMVNLEYLSPKQYREYRKLNFLADYSR